MTNDIPYDTRSIDPYVTRDLELKVFPRETNDNTTNYNHEVYYEKSVSCTVKFHPQ